MKFTREQFFFCDEIVTYKGNIFQKMIVWILFIKKEKNSSVGKMLNKKHNSLTYKYVWETYCNMLSEKY